MLSVPVIAQFGSPNWPVDWEQRFAKAQACLELRGLPGAVETLALVHDDFETVPDVFAALAPAFGCPVHDAGTGPRLLPFIKHLLHCHMQAISLGSL